MAQPWMFFAIHAALVIGFASAVNVAETSAVSLRGVPMASFVQSLDFKQVLRVCNAYPLDTGLDVYLGKKKLTSSPLAYKSCEEFSPRMVAGDEVDFKAGGDTAGTFTIDELPANDATLLMVVYRHDSLSSAVAFESHVFANVGATQVAVVDTYKGKAQSELRIKDGQAKTNLTRSELLRYESVVGLSAGLYELELQKPPNSQRNSTPHAELVALPRHSYVVIRCGVESEDGKSYPEELMIFPNSNRAELGAALPSRGVQSRAVAFAVAAALFWLVGAA